jgi:hypothetical protein
VLPYSTVQHRRQHAAQYEASQRHQHIYIQQHTAYNTAVYRRYGTPPAWLLVGLP